MIAGSEPHALTGLGLLPLGVLGGLLGMDVVSFPQAMLSRPIVAATAAGAMTGGVWHGFVAGVVMELFALETLPVGASRYPEWGSAAVVGGALAGSLHLLGVGALVAAVLGALVISWAGGRSMIALRQMNGALAKRDLAALDRGSRNAVVGLQLIGLTVDLLRGALLTMAGLLLFGPLAEWVGRHWSLPPRLTSAALFGVALAVAGSALWRLFDVTPGARWYFAAGLAVGVGVLAFG